MCKERKYPRLKPISGTVCIVTNAGGQVVIGRLNDISLDGVGINYLSDKVLTGTNTTIDVMLPHQSVELSRISCRTVYDITVPVREGESFKSHWRHCGLQFVELSDVAKQRVEIFLKQYCNDAQL